MDFFLIFSYKILKLKKKIFFSGLPMKPGTLDPAPGPGLITMDMGGDF